MAQTHECPWCKEQIELSPDHWFGFASGNPPTSQTADAKCPKCGGRLKITSHKDEERWQVFPWKDEPDVEV